MKVTIHNPENLPMKTIDTKFPDGSREITFEFGEGLPKALEAGERVIPSGELSPEMKKEILLLVEEAMHDPESRISWTAKLEWDTRYLSEVPKLKDRVDRLEQKLFDISIALKDKEPA